MKKRNILSFLLMALSLTSCSVEKNTEVNSSSGIAQTEQTTKNTGQTQISSHKVLVAYFSRVGNTDFPKNVDAVASASLNVTKDGVEGNTEIVAKMIQKTVDGDLFLIQREDKVPSDYDATDRQGEEEHKENARPKLATHVENINSYDTVILVYPNWYYDMPMAVYSFLDEYDLSGKNIIAFCTSGGSGFSNSIETIGKMEPKATILEGIAISEKIPANAEENIRNRLSKLGVIQ